LPRFCVDDKPLGNGDHMIHLTTCKRLPDVSRCNMLGELETYEQARAQALKQYQQVNACYLCLPEHYKAQ
jgi:hypothetical protein